MVNESIADRLKSVRLNELQGMGHAPLARLISAAGYPVAAGLSVKRYEDGEREAPAEYVRVFAKVAKVDPGWLVAGGERSLPSAPPVHSVVLEPIGNEERVRLMGMLAGVQKALADGQETKPGPRQETSPGISLDEMESDMEHHLSEESGAVEPPEEREPTGTDG